ncbi:MAG: hypothetical protein JXR61_14255 [Prolixibacteraceae bacterium]|nr:hypothetical protein [Prolixibacteraceae bacterium]
MNKRNLGKVLLFGLIPVLWTSCNNDISEPFEAVSDVFMVNQIMNDDTVHALTYYVYGNMEITSANVAKENDQENREEMVALNNSNLLMALEPDENDFKTIPDTSTMFLFNIMSKGGVSVQVYDYFDPQGLGIPEITNISFSDQNKMIVKWNDLEDAQSYLVKVNNAAGENSYISIGLNASVNELTLNDVYGSWIAQPENGETYTVQVHALIYEEGVNSYVASYNIEEISIGEESVIWE